MNLLHISPSYYPAIQFGGPIQSIHLLNKTLVKKSISVDVVTTTAGLNAEQLSLLNQDWNNIEGVRVKYLSYIGYQHYNFSLPVVKILNSIIENYDIVHISAVWNFPVLAASFLSWIKSKPYLISPKGALHQQALNFKSHFVKKIYFSLFASHYLKSASAIHYTSTLEKAESELILKRKNGFVVPNGVDLSLLNNEYSPELIKKYGIGTNKKYLLILGRINQIKGFDLLIPAISEILKRSDNLFLVIAGDNTNSYTDTIKAMIKEQGIIDRVIFTGEVSGETKWALYKNAVLFILPSYSENFGMSVVEAMACGCPVLISDKVGLYQDIKEYDAGIVCKTDVADIKDNVINLLNDSQLRFKISKNAVTLVKNKYDIDKVTDQFIIQYNKLLKLHE